MQKKLIAVAVAGALGAPALALAQASTVQLYGKATFEYGLAHQGGVGATAKPNTDILQTPGGSAVGVRGEEQLGGGLSAWFQCESSADVRGLNQDGFCSRNSALGFKGAWGNLHVGRWDTPFKRAITVGMIGAGDTGLLGGAFLMAGNSTGTGALGGQGASQSLSRNVWKRRESGLIYYESPSFSGFNILAAYSPANATAVTNLTTAAKPRVESIAGIYANGPLALSLAYEKHKNFTAVGGGGDDRGWTLAGAYTFARVFKLGGTYVDTKYEMGSGLDLTKKNWMVGADWNISGPHHLDLSYERAGNSKGNAITNTGLGGGNGGIAIPGPSTGAHLWEIGYTYIFSKRTDARIGYVKLNNNSNAFYSLGGLAAAPTAGTSQNAWVTYVQHRW